MPSCRVAAAVQRPSSPILPPSPLSLSMPRAFRKTEVDAVNDVISTRSPDMSPILPPTPPSAKSEDLADNFELQQSAEILCRIADTDSHSPPRTQAVLDQVCMEEQCQSPMGQCMHYPVIPLLQLPYVSPVAPSYVPSSTPRNTSSTPPPMSAFQMAPWVIYPDPPPNTSVFPPLSDQEWSTLTATDFVPDPGLWKNMDPFVDGEPLQNENYIYTAEGYQVDCAESFPGDAEFIGSPAVDMLLSTLPPDTPVEERRGWAYALSTPQADHSRFFGSFDHSSDLACGNQEPWKLSTPWENEEQDDRANQADQAEFLTM